MIIFQWQNFVFVAIALIAISACSDSNNHATSQSTSLLNNNSSQQQPQDDDPILKAYDEKNKEARLKHEQKTILFKAYAKNLHDKIKSEWNWKCGEVNSPAIATISLNMKGGLSKVYISKSSGNSKFDSRALEAINKAAPFPAPSEEILELFETVKINFDQHECK